MTIKALYPNIIPSLLLDFANVENLDPRITFARASTARYYNGVTTAKAEENLLIRSQEFDDAVIWSSSGIASRTANNETAPDGTSTADTIRESSDTSVHRIDQSGFVASGLVVLSVFAKLGAGTRFLTISVSDAANASNSGSATFNLAAGTNTQTQANGAYSGPSATIVAVAQGFYRCTLTVTASVASGVRIALNDTGTPTSANRGIGSTYTGDNTSSLILWGAQLEQRSAVTAYTPTTTQPITNYVPVLLSAANNVARFDHNPVTGESLGLLIEEQRTNLFERSEEFENAYWTKTNSSVTANTIVAPDGTLTGDKIVENTANGVHDVRRIVAASASTAYTQSVYVKAAERTRGELQMFGNSGGSTVTFNLTAGTVTVVGPYGGWASTSATITNVGNGWYRVTHTATTNAGLTVFNSTFNTQNAAGSGSYTGDGYSGIFIWGAQLESGSFSTSYIATVASAVTRSADAASMTGANFSSWYNAAEGTLYAEAMLSYTPAASTFPMLACADDGTINNRIALSTNSSRDIRAQVAIGGVFTTISTATSYSVGTPFKAAAAFATNNHAVSLNSGTVATNTAVGMPPPASTFRIGEQAPSGANVNGRIRKLAYYPKRLANAELQALTQI
jgi:hypothetical protein